MDQPAPPAIVLVLTTLGENADARALAQTLVTERLAACVNVLPLMFSVYRWKGTVESDREQQLVIKTSSERLGALKARLADLHPYEVPELLVVPVLETALSYRAWLLDALSRP
jgi:periplasmic divalent cation tolerance protein